jgi:glycosyltransferase involved in cell wall biosynthesis
MDINKLTIIPSVPVWREGKTITFDRKFFDGILLYKNIWRGSITCICVEGEGCIPSSDVVSKEMEDLPFDVCLLKAETVVDAVHLKDSDIVMASGDSHNQLHVSALCRQMSIPCVYVIEYIPQTRHQIVSIESKNLLRRWWKSIFLWRSERKRKVAFTLAEGLQCNGIAAHDHYFSHPNRLLYFDTRTRRESLITESELSVRLNHLLKGGPIRLAFSGRLIGMKGADHLISVAHGLREQGIDFHLNIYGTGEMEEKMQMDIQKLQLKNYVTMHGSVDFDSHLIPEIKSNVDLYVMLHRQSDPSCTYLETLACGIPIVGYDNKALTGILKRADVGFSVPMDDIKGVISTVKRLSSNRQMLNMQSQSAAIFASNHSFEDTFNARVKHLQSVLKAHVATQPYINSENE